MTFKNFGVTTLAPGVFAAIASDSGAAGSNCGIIDLGNETIVFDTSSTLTAAAELLAAGQELTGRAPKYVINSHSHPDHIQGNAVFSENAVLISSSITKQEIELHGAKEMKKMKTDIHRQIEQIQKMLDSDELCKLERMKLLSNLDTFHNILGGYPSAVDLRLPSLTFEKSISFHGDSRSVQLITVGAAHSKCDSVLWLPDEQILFIGDLVIPNGNLILSLGVPEKWPVVLHRLEGLGAQTLVPGHGNVTCATEGYSDSLDYLELMFSIANEAIKSETGPRYVDQLDVPSGHSEYWFRKDLTFLIDCQSKKASC